MNQISYFTVLRNIRYRRLLYSNLINRLGDAMDTLAFSWIVYTFTGKGFWAAIIFAINKIPAFIVLPFVGAYVEKLNKRHMLIRCDIVRCTLVVMLLIVMIANQLSVAILAIFSFFISLAEAFRIPASTSFVTQILDKENLDRGITLNVAASTVIEMIGMALGGVLIISLGVYSAIFFDALSFIISTILILTIKHKEIIDDHIKAAGNWRLLKSGIIYIKSCSILKTTFIIAILANMVMSPIDSLQTVMVVNIFHADAGYLSVLNICLSGGMILGGITYPTIKSRIKDELLFKGSFLFISSLYVIIALVGLTKSINMMTTAIFSVLYVFYGIFASFLAVGLGLRLLETTEQSYMARINTLYSAITAAATPLAAAVAGLLINYLSITVIYMAIASVMFVSLIFVFFKNSKKY